MIVCQSYDSSFVGEHFVMLYSSLCTFVDQCTSDVQKANNITNINAKSSIIHKFCLHLIHFYSYTFNNILDQWFSTFLTLKVPHLININWDCWHIELTVIHFCDSRSFKNHCSRYANRIS